MMGRVTARSRKSTSLLQGLFSFCPYTKWWEITVIARAGLTCLELWLWDGTGSSALKCLLQPIRFSALISRQSSKYSEIQELIVESWWTPPISRGSPNWKIFNVEPLEVPKMQHLMHYGPRLISHESLLFIECSFSFQANIQSLTVVACGNKGECYLLSRVVVTSG